MIRLIVGALLCGAGVWLLCMPLPTEMSGLCCLGFGFLFLFHWFVSKRKWKKGWKTAIWSVGIGVLAILSVAIAAISLSGRSDWDGARKTDYAVVLGAQIWGTRPSLILQQRLDAALVYMEENPDAVVVVSGGQGSDEIVTEASVMEEYLLSHGADSSRIFREEEASNTRENLLHTAEIVRELGIDPGKPTIITSEFHMARAKYIAGSVGMEAVGISSRTQPFQTKVNSLIREVFAFCKAWVVIQVS